MARAKLLFFNGEETLSTPHGLNRKAFEAKFSTAKAAKIDAYTLWVGYTSSGEMLPVERIIEFKANPSLHKCDARCQNAKGHLCECSCGGKNHGKN